MSQSEKTLVTTMGGQAQVVTFALDWFLARSEPVREVIVLHLSPQDPRVHTALEQLAAEFPGGQYAQAGLPIRLRQAPIASEHGPLFDIRDEAGAEATWQTVYRLIANLKSQNRTLHVCIAGGRRLMGLMAMSAAMLHFDHQDRLWHLYAPDQLRERAADGAVMHVEPDEGVRLIQVPISPWGAYFPGLKELIGAPSSRVIAAQAQWLESEDRARCRRVVERLTERQKVVLQLFAAGRTPQEVAEALSVSLKTVDTHKTNILAECHNEWAAPPGGRLDYHFLRNKFGPYLKE